MKKVLSEVLGAAILLSITIATSAVAYELASRSLHVLETVSTEEDSGYENCLTCSIIKPSEANVSLILIYNHCNTTLTPPIVLVNGVESGERISIPPYSYTSIIAGSDVESIEIVGEGFVYCREP